MLFIATNAISGILLLEWAWKKNVRFREPIQELEDLMPAFRRYDAKNWARWAHYPGAMTIMIPRLFLVNILSVIFIIIIKFLMLGQQNGEPI